MAEAPVRAQVSPVAGVSTLLWTAGAYTVVSTLRACNTGRTVDYIRVRKVLAGEAEADRQYLVYETPVPPGQSFAMTEGETLLGEDSIYVSSRNGSVAFNLSGVEFS